MPIVFDEVIAQVESPQPQPAQAQGQGSAGQAQPATDLVEQLRRIEVLAKRLKAD